ncbi:protein-disulfide reductase DsbD family protein [Lysobacter humi (ex Lee et al. 2017)]
MPDLLRFPHGLRAALAALVLCLLAAFAPARAAVSLDDLLPVDEAFALTTRSTEAGIELRWTIAPGYYLYRHRMSVASDPGFEAGALRLPKGKAYTDEFFGPVETYRGALVALLPGTPRAARTVLTVKYQGCADAGICYPPQTRRIAVELPAAAGGLARAMPFGGAPFGAPGAGVDAMPLPEAQAFGFEAIAGDGNTVLLRFAPARGYYLYRDRTTLRLDAESRSAGLTLGQPRWPAATPHRDEHFGDVQVYFDTVDVPLPIIRRTPGPLRLRLIATFQGCQTDGICYPPMTRTVSVDLPRGDVGARPVRPATAAVTDAAGSTGEALAGIGTALLFALLGGLVLNLMPCVLPVLSLKALALTQSGTPADARRHAFAYTAGVVLSFLALGVLALGLRQTGQALGWGFQMQQPLVVAMLALVMFVFGLSLSGLWHLGGRWVGAGQSLAAREGLAGDFFTGVLAVVVATPCTAPFMVPALAWAFVAPAPMALAVFLMLGVGLALPFLLIGTVPALAARLPRPGAWMETLKQALAFPLYLTAAWLLWVLGRQRGADAIGWGLVAMVALAFAAWAWNRARDARRAWGLTGLLTGLVIAGFALVTIEGLPRPEPSANRTVAEDRVPFSAERLASLRGSGRTVFVNVTADWCVTCKANERTVLARPAFRELMQRTGAVYMVGDWTDVDPALTAFLQSHRAVGVPLYVVYPKGGEPRVLPTVLTAGALEAALTGAAP